MIKLNLSLVNIIIPFGNIAQVSKAYDVIKTGIVITKQRAGMTEIKVQRKLLIRNKMGQTREEFEKTNKNYIESRQSVISLKYQNIF